MEPERQYHFPPFRLDPVNQQLWREEEAITIRRKTFEVLHYLVDHPAQLVTKAALLDVIWAKMTVSDSMPAICVGEIRRALGDQTKPYRFIETVPGRGYRFVAPVANAPAGFVPISGPSGAPLPVMVGREDELARLRSWYSRVRDGERRIVFVGGETGIGKTTFVRAFLDNVAREGIHRIARGQCIEQYGEGEPYMPVLEALTTLCRGRGGERVLEVLRRLAPTWLAQMPALLNEAERAARQIPHPAISRDGMLLEMAQALEELAVASPLVLFIEDLHWSDHSTLELISTLARRSAAARLLVIGTYRPLEMLEADHPLRNLHEELRIHWQCEELQLKLLGLDDVAVYLATRFTGQSSLDRLAQAVHRRTDGNPLFFVNLVDYLLALEELDSDSMVPGLVRLLEAGRIEVPRTIREMIERALERLRVEQRAVIEAASVAGAAFSAATVSAAVGMPVDVVEGCCTELSRHRQFVSSSGASVWPDGTIATSYQFLHTFYREVLYERMSAAHRARLHRRIAEWEEEAYGKQAGDIAAELAHHSEQGGLHEQASKYYQLAGDSALRGFASYEAETHFRLALRMIEKSPQTAERDERELKALMGLRVALTATRGSGFAGLGEVLHRAAELCRRLGRDAELVTMLLAGAFHHMFIGEMGRAAANGSEALAVAIRAEDSARIAQSYCALGSTHYWMGLFHESRAELEKALALGSQDNRLLDAANTSAIAPLAAALLLSRHLWMLGFPDQSRVQDRQCLEIVKRTNDPFLLASAQIYGAEVPYYCGDVDQVDQRSTEGQSLLGLSRSEHPQLIGWCGMLAGWVKAQRGQPLLALRLITDGFSIVLASENRIAMPVFGCLMAKAQTSAGRPEEALMTLERTLQTAEETGQHYSDSELLRLRGELLLMSGAGAAPDAEECFRAALAIARRQQAKSWELRTTMCLARLLAAQGKREEGHAMLAESYGWFTEGFDTADLKEAKALLEELAK